MRRMVLLAALVCVLACIVPYRASAQSSSAARAARLKADLRDVLSSPEYRYAPPQPTILDRMAEAIQHAWKWTMDKLDRFWQWLRRLFGMDSRSGRTGRQIAIVPIVLYILLAAGILALIGYGGAALARWIVLRRARAGTGRKRPSVEQIVIEPEESADAEPDAWIRAAQAHLAAGELRKAYRAVFIAILVRLDHIGAIRFERSRTNGDYLRALRSRAPLLALIRPAALAFDARWYGGQSVSDEDYRVVMRTYEELKK